MLVLVAPQLPQTAASPTESRVITVAPSALELIGPATYYASCPSPETSGNPCVFLLPAGRARTRFAIEPLGLDPESAADFLRVGGRLGTNTFLADCRVKLTVEWLTMTSPRTSCRGSPTSLFQVDGGIPAGEGVIEFRCEDERPGTACRIAIYEVTVTYGLTPFTVSFGSRELPTGELCVSATVTSWSPPYRIFKVDFDWGFDREADDFFAPSDGSSPRWERCRQLFPTDRHVVRLSVTDGLGRMRETTYEYPSGPARPWLDAAQAPRLVSFDFEDGPDGWRPESNVWTWSRTEISGPAEPRGGAGRMRAGGSSALGGSLVSPPIPLPRSGEIHAYAWGRAYGCESIFWEGSLDGGTSWESVAEWPTGPGTYVWQDVTADLSYLKGETIELRFRFVNCPWGGGRFDLEYVHITVEPTHAERTIERHQAQRTALPMVAGLSPYIGVDARLTATVGYGEGAAGIAPIPLGSTTVCEGRCDLPFAFGATARLNRTLEAGV